MAETRNIKWVNNAAGISIILLIINVVIGNYFLGDFNLAFTNCIYQITLFISIGYSLKESISTGSFINSAFRSLMFPYFVTCMFFLLKDIFNSIVFSGISSYKEITHRIYVIISSAFYASGYNMDMGGFSLEANVGNLWFLPAIFFAIVIFQVLLKNVKKDITLGIITGFMAAAGFISARIWWLPFSIQSAMAISFFVWVGYEIRKHSILSKLRYSHYILALLITTAGIYFHYGYAEFSYLYFVDPFISSFIGVCAFLLVYLISSSDKKGKLLDYAGRNFITLLCCHAFTFKFLGHELAALISLSGIQRHRIQFLVSIIFNLAVPVIFTVLINLFRRHFLPWYVSVTTKQDQALALPKRDNTVSVARGIWVLLMLIGHFTIDDNLNWFIYSFHMPAFVIFSGYFYRKDRSFWRTVLHMMRTFLLPYLVFVILTILVNAESFSPAYLAGRLATYGLGMSFSMNLFPGTETVGPVYFILMLFLIRVFYMILDRLFSKEMYKNLAILIVSIGGVLLGYNGLWLPWSADVALYCLVFYRIGFLLKKYRILDKIRDCHILYFLLSIFWAFSVHYSVLGIASRLYGIYSLIILSSLSGTLLSWKLSYFINSKLAICRFVLKWIGDASLIIILFHTLISMKLYSLTKGILKTGSFLQLVVLISIQVLAGVLIYAFIEFLKKAAKKKKAA